jgi:putative N6-adenine-specific DNA methylase
VRAGPAQPQLFASDRAAGAVAQTRMHLANARVEAFVQVTQADVLERTAPAPGGVLLANPPYGVRLDEAQALAAFYPRLGDALKRHFTGWEAFLFTGDLRLARLIGLKPARRTPLYNGALECRLFAFPLVAGSMRG